MTSRFVLRCSLLGLGLSLTRSLGWSLTSCLLLWQSCIHLDHLRVEAVSGGIQLRATLRLIVVQKFLLTLLLALLQKGLPLGLEASFARFKTIVIDLNLG